LSKKTNYNSIVFLTTLSVYLGLVLVGGTAPILAHSAMTRDFDIKNEIEFKDDLDKKPDDETCAELKVKNGGQNKQFIEEYAASVLEIAKKVYFTQLDGYELSVNARYRSFEGIDELLGELFPSANKDLAVDQFSYTADKDKFYVNFKLKSKFENKDISALGSAYAESIDLLLRQSPDKPANLVLKHTEITFENNQVFIVTRLPRASIDELLAK
jgi:hypothetical protein